MHPDLIVAITFGQRDLQFLAATQTDGGRQVGRVSPHKRHVGALHRALRDGRIPYRLWLPDAPADLPREIEDTEAVWRDGRVAFNREGVTAADPPGVTDASPGTIWLVPGLLTRDLLCLREEARGGTVRVRQILLFHTDRGDEGRRADTEPVAAVPVYAAWLCDQLTGLEPGAVIPVCCLGVSDELTEEDETGNRHLRRAAAERIDAPLRRAAAAFPAAAIRLHVSGGIPALSEVVTASAQVRFPGRVQYRSPSEDRGRARTPCRGGTPAEALAARRRACELIHIGEFQAAEVLTRGLLADNPGAGAGWVRCLRAVARYFTGYQDEARLQAEALSAFPSARRLVALIRDPLPRCFHVALRAEAALRADDTLAAAALAVTFLDVALMDAIDASLRRDPQKSCLNRNGREIHRAAFLPTLDDLDAAAEAIYGSEPWLTHFTPEDVWRWHKRQTMLVLDRWQRHLALELIRQVGRRPDLASPLVRLFLTLQREDTTGVRLADLRNSMVHSLPTQDEIAQAARLFEEAGIWPRQEGTGPRRVLVGSLLVDVLVPLGARDAVGEYDGLVADLERDILTCPLD